MIRENQIFKNKTKHQNPTHNKKNPHTHPPTKQQGKLPKSAKQVEKGRAEAKEEARPRLEQGQTAAAVCQNTEQEKQLRGMKMHVSKSVTEKWMKYY